MLVLVCRTKYIVHRGLSQYNLPSYQWSIKIRRYFDGMILFWEPHASESDLYVESDIKYLQLKFTQEVETSVYFITPFAVACPMATESKKHRSHIYNCFSANTNAEVNYTPSGPFNSLRPRLNRRPFEDDIFKCIILNENVWIQIKISLKFVPGGPINNIPALVQIMAWRRPGDKPLSEPMMVGLPTHICVARPQWVN